MAQNPQTNQLQLPIHAMDQRHFGLTKAIADYQLEAARVCLDRFHQSPVVFRVQDSRSKTDAIVFWQPTDDRIKRAWNNKNSATEQGAHACVIAAVELVCQLICVGRADTGTGVDFYMAPPGTTVEDFEDQFVLEISGVSGGGHAAVRGRLKEKIDQVKDGNSNLPAIAGVTGFRVQIISLERIDQE